MEAKRGIFYGVGVGPGGNCGQKGELVCRDLTRLPERLGYYTTVMVKE